LLEKPIAADRNDVDRIETLTAEASRPVVPGHLLRFDPRYAGIEAAVSGGNIGELISLSARRAIPRAWSERMGDRIHPVKQIGTHDVDLLRWISPSPITRVRTTATTQAVTGLEIPDPIHATLIFDSGACASVRLVSLWPDGFPADIDARMEVIGTDGGAVVEISAGDLQLATDRTDYPDTAYWPRVHNRVTGTLRSQFDHFLDCLDGAESIVTMADAVRAFEITEAIIDAIGVDGSVTVSP
jgi:UDP-N-acetylglucosamine 3-dehydrogenase